MPPVPATPVVTRVEWLPSGTGRGIVRVSGRGQRVEALPELRVTQAGGESRFESLPDGGSEPGAWRAAYVVEESRLAVPGVELALLFPDGVSIALPPPPVTPGPPAPPVAPEPELAQESAGGQVIDRAVLAERRARRAEAAEQAQTRIAERALRAVEVLEGRADEIDRRLAEAEAERDALRAQAAEPAAGDGASVELLAELESERSRAAALIAQLEHERRRAEEAGRNAETLRRLLAAAGVALTSLRQQVTELRATLKAGETAHAATRVRLAAAEREPPAASPPAAAVAPEPALDAEPPLLADPPPARDELVAAPEEAAAEAPVAEADEPIALGAPDSLAASPESLAAIHRSLAELTRPVGGTAPEPPVERVAADLDAAAAALRDRAVPVAPPVREPSPPADEDASHLPPTAPARPLPEALLALAREDPAIAARLLVALLPVQHVALSGPIDYDLTIAEIGTFAISATPFTASVTERERPRAFWHRSFHVRGGSVALIELLAGRRPVRRLRGPIRVRGRHGRARELLTRMWTAASAQALLDAGARLPADAVIPLLPHLVEPSWTTGHRFCVQIIVDHPWYIRALDGDGVAVGRTTPPGVAIDTTLQLSAGAFAASIAGRRLGANDRFDLSGDPRPVAILFGWVQRARGG